MKRSDSAESGDRRPGEGSPSGERGRSRRRLSPGLIVLGLVVILVGVMLFRHLVDDKATTCEQLARKIEAYHEDHGEYPEDWRDAADAGLRRTIESWGLEGPWDAFYYERFEGGFLLRYSEWGFPDEFRHELIDGEWGHWRD